MTSLRRRSRVDPGRRGDGHRHRDRGRPAVPEPAMGWRSSRAGRMPRAGPATRPRSSTPRRARSCPTSSSGRPTSTWRSAASRSSMRANRATCATSGPSSSGCGRSRPSRSACSCWPPGGATAGRLWRAVRRGSLGLTVVVVALGVGSLVAFDAMFELFHRIFFPAGSYTFDPTTERLVQLFPFQFWEETAFVVGVVIVAIALVVAVVAGRRRAPVPRPEAGHRARRATGHPMTATAFTELLSVEAARDAILAGVEPVERERIATGCRPGPGPGETGDRRGIPATVAELGDGWVRDRRGGHERRRARMRRSSSRSSATCAPGPRRTSRFAAEPPPGSRRAPGFPMARTRSCRSS